MKFCELAKILHKYRRDRSETTAMCVQILTDAILDDVALEKIGSADEDINPMYGKKESTLQAIYSGKRLKISEEDAGIMLSRVDEAHFADFVNQYSYDALSQMSEDISKYGFDAHPDNVGEICGNIMAQIINNRAEGKSDDITTLTIKKKETGKRVKDIAPATIERRGDKLHICGEEIVIHQMLVPQNVANIELKYIKALCDAYAQALGRTAVTEADIPSLPDPFPEDYTDQRKAYYSAESIEHSIRDTFDDGEDEFAKLKKDAWDGIRMTYRNSRRYADGYERLVAVLEKVTSTTLDLSVLSQIRNLIGNLEKMGICHILVNDGTISSWVV